MRRAELVQRELVWFYDFRGDWDQERQRAERIVHDLEAIADDVVLAKAWLMVAWSRYMVGESASAVAATRHAADLAIRAGEERLRTTIIRWHLTFMFLGPASVDQIAHEAEQVAEAAQRTGRFSLEATALDTLAGTLAMRGEAEHARRIITDAGRVTPEQLDRLAFCEGMIAVGRTELLAGDPQRAERVLRECLQHLESTRATPYLTYGSALLSRALLLQGHDAEAERYVLLCKDATVETHRIGQVRWRQVHALLLALRGDAAVAEAVAREATTRAQALEQPELHGEAFEDLARILQTADEHARALAVAHQALDAYQRKGHTAAVQRMQRLIDQLALPAPEPPSDHTGRRR